MEAARERQAASEAALWRAMDAEAAKRDAEQARRAAARQKLMSEVAITREQQLAAKQVERAAAAEASRAQRMRVEAEAAAAAAAAAAERAREAYQAAQLKMGLQVGDGQGGWLVDGCRLRWLLLAVAGRPPALVQAVLGGGAAMLSAASHALPLQAQMAAKQARRVAQEAAEREAREEARREEEEHGRRVQEALRRGMQEQWHGLAKHEW